MADLMTLMEESPGSSNTLLLHHPTEEGTSRKIEKGHISKIEPLLEDVLRDGKVVCVPPSIEEIRNRRKADVERLDSGVKRLINPHIYHVSLSSSYGIKKRR